MRGQNSMRINKATLMEALGHWIGRRLFQGGQAPRVVDVVFHSKTTELTIVLNGPLPDVTKTDVPDEAP